MRITEQIDALTVMALSPMRYLVAPSIFAGILTFPLMTALFDVIGIFGGYLVGVELLGLSAGTYFGEMQSFVDIGDVLLGNVSLEDALVLDDVADVARLREAHEQGVPVVVRAADERAVARALARPEVACVLVPPEQRGLRDLDLRKITYG